MEDGTFRAKPDETIDEHVKKLWIAALAERGVSVAMPKETADDKND